MWLIVISLRQYSANGNVDDLNELIAQEADVNGTGPSLYIATPLYYATNRSHLNIVNTFITAGADVNKTDNNGVTLMLPVIKVT